MDFNVFLTEADELLAALSNEGDSVTVQKLRLLILIDHSNISSVLQTPGPLAPAVSREALANFENTKSLVAEYLNKAA